MQSTKTPSKFIFIRLLPWFFAFILVLVIYYFLKVEMESQLKAASKGIKQNRIEKSIKELGQMEILHYRFRDVLYFETLKPYFKKGIEIPNGEPFIVISGVAVGGIRMQEVEESDFTFYKDSTVIFLPKPVIFEYKIDTAYRYISEFEIDQLNLKQAVTALRNSGDPIKIKNLSIDIGDEHILKIITPVLEAMTQEELVFHFKSE